jgi:AraC-like DNA-binding protein
MALLREHIRLLPDESLRVLRWEDNVRDVEVLGLDGTPRPLAGAGEQWHYHPELELTLITAGAGTRFVGDSIATFQGPDLVLIGSDVPHYWHGLHDSSGCAVQFGFEEEQPLRRLKETAALERLFAEARRGIRFSGATAAAAAAHVRAMVECGVIDRLGHFMLALGTLAAAAKRERALLSRTVFIPSKRQATYRGIRDAIRLVLDRFHEPLRFVDALGRARMSPATFNRQFRAHTGKTFTRFLNEVRIDAACRQLVETARSVSEIAFACGYGNISHFNHQFRALRATTPRAFRAAHASTSTGSPRALGGGRTPSPRTAVLRRPRRGPRSATRAGAAGGPSSRRASRSAGAARRR